MVYIPQADVARDQRIKRNVTRVVAVPVSQLDCDTRCSFHLQRLWIQYIQI